MNQPGERARGFGREPSRWRDEAACRDLADQHFDPWDSADKALEPHPVAVQYCSTCPVRRACLIEAIAHNETYGTWGGLTLKQRKKITRARSRVKCPICGGKLLAVTSDHTQTCLSCGIAWRTIAATRSAPATTPEYQPMSRYSPATDRRTA